MRVHRLGVILLVSAIGCSKTPESKPDKKPRGTENARGQDEKPKPKQKDKPKEKAPDQKSVEVEARQKLVSMLDSWSFGDTLKTFNANNPSISVVEPNWSIGSIVGVKLVRYEVRSARKRAKENGRETVAEYEFLVALEFRNRSEGNSASRIYTVMKHKDGSWTILSLPA